MTFCHTMERKSKTADCPKQTKTLDFCHKVRICLVFCSFLGVRTHTAHTVEVVSGNHSEGPDVVGRDLKHWIILLSRCR